jgi:hypothetical protein
MALFRLSYLRAHARNPGPGAQRGRAAITEPRRVMLEPSEDLWECLEVVFIRACHGCPEIVHQNR